jgi:hypothetical protein
VRAWWDYAGKSWYIHRNRYGSTWMLPNLSNKPTKLFRKPPLLPKISVSNRQVKLSNRSWDPTKKTLVIRNVQDRLSADHYLPSISSLQELTLTHFWNLTDTHIHVMLLMTLRQKKQQQQQQKNPLRSLLLEDCPRLSNSAIRSIGVQCTNLELLSLKGMSK